ncbi:hypothetical protein [Microbacterium xylanilyticum]
MAGALRAGVAAALVAAAVGLAGCTPGPAPKPTPTPLFTSEADAFKAAEAVYREYTDAGAKADSGDATARPEDYLAGAALEDELASQRDLKSQGLTIKGAARVESFSGSKFSPETSQVAADVCLDVSQTRIIDKSGGDVTPANRPLLVPLQVEFTRAGSSLLIAKSASADIKC